MELMPEGMIQGSAGRVTESVDAGDVGTNDVEGVAVVDLWRCRPRLVISQKLGGPSGAEDIFVLRHPRVLRIPVRFSYCKSLPLKPTNRVWSSDIEAIAPPSASETTSQEVLDFERTRVCEGATGLR
jgi:hypothetical protein